MTGRQRKCIPAGTPHTRIERERERRTHPPAPVSCLAAPPGLPKTKRKRAPCHAPIVDPLSFALPSFRLEAYARACDIAEDTEAAIYDRNQLEQQGQSSAKVGGSPTPLQPPSSFFSSFFSLFFLSLGWRY